MQWFEFITNHPFMISAAVALAVVIIVTEIKARKVSGLGLSAQDTVRLMNKGALVVDVRDPESYAAGHLDGSINIPIKALPEREAEITKSRSKPMLVVCEHGQFSAKAARGLRGSGFELVFFLKEGVNGWRGENLPLHKA